MFRKLSNEAGTGVLGSGQNKLVLGSFPGQSCQIEAGFQGRAELESTVAEFRVLAGCNAGSN